MKLLALTALPMLAFASLASAASLEVPGQNTSVERGTYRSYRSTVYVRERRPSTCHDIRITAYYYPSGAYYIPNHRFYGAIGTLCNRGDLRYY